MRVGNIQFDNAFARTAAENAAALESFQRFANLIAQIVFRIQKLLDAGVNVVKGKIGGNEQADADDAQNGYQKQ